MGHETLAILPHQLNFSARYRGTSTRAGKEMLETRRQSKPRTICKIDVAKVLKYTIMTGMPSRLYLR
jgi:hypothetical protein